MDEFTIDEEIHEPSDIKKLKLAKKKEIAKAKKFLRQQQEQYKQPLESRESSASESNDELIEYRQYLESAKTQQEMHLKNVNGLSKKVMKYLAPSLKVLNSI